MMIGFACLGFMIYRKRATDAEKVSSAEAGTSHKPPLSLVHGDSSPGHGAEQRVSRPTLGFRDL